MIKSDELISRLLADSRELQNITEEKFASASFDRLNHRPAKNSWSAAECLDHIIVTNNQYIPLIEKEIENAENSSPPGEEFKSTFAGRFMVYSLDPSNKRKMKSPRVFRPEIKIYTKEVVQVFLDQNNTIYNLICRSRDKNLTEIKINSPVTRLLKYNLGDCFRIINTHSKRHINQALRALNSF